MRVSNADVAAARRMFASLSSAAVATMGAMTLTGPTAEARRMARSWARRMAGCCS